MDDAELLKGYVRERSESAFAALLKRHIDLVYSAALRQLDGDTHAAEDVTQAVFIDLARQANKLAGHGSIMGWLYTSTRYAALNARRTEQRRQLREQTAELMNATLTAGTEPDWLELRPVLDEAMHELAETDRLALLWRFFEKQPLAKVGARLNLSENAARMRVERALEKLREALAKRGVTSTAAAIGLLVTHHAVLAAPAALFGRIAQTAADLHPVAAATMASAILAFLKSRTGLATVASVLMVAGIIWMLSMRPEAQFGERGAGKIVADTMSNETNAAAIAASTQPFPTTLVAPSPVAGDTVVSNRIRVICLAADANKPVPNVPIEARIWAKAGFVRKTNTALRTGICDIDYSPEVVWMELTTRIDGFADTRLYWRPDRGEVIPPEYTVRLDRSQLISGRVIDADKQPVADAQVGFNHQQDPVLMSRTESHAFSWRATRTDGEGRWQLDCIAPEMLRELYGSASHTNHAPSEMVWASRDATVEAKLREGTMVFKLGRALEVTGVVRDTNGSPVSGAKVLAGRVGEGNRRQATSDVNGAFSLRGVPLGKRLVTAEAEGFASSTIEVEISATSAPVELVLQRGSILRLRVVSHSDAPIEDAGVWLNTFRAGRDGKGKPGVQTEFSRRTDAEGRLVWTNAPDEELTFSVTAKGHMNGRDIVLRADGEEHTVKLGPALTIRGAVRDAGNGQPVPRFKIISGYTLQVPDGQTPQPRWSNIDRFWMTFDGGQFKHVFEEPVVGGGNYQFIFKFEAEGYVAAISRAVSADEGEAQLDMVLQRGAAQTITVLNSNGKPALNADVGLIGMGAGVQFKLGGLSRDNPQSGGSLLLTDVRGRFQLPADRNITHIVAANTNGYALLPRSDLEKDPVVTLQPWGRIEGTLTWEGKPLAKEQVLFQVGGGWHATEFVTSSMECRSITDSQGRFTFSQVPPGKHQVARLVPVPSSGFGTAHVHEPLGTVEIQPGETTRVMMEAQRPPAKN